MTSWGAGHKRGEEGVTGSVPSPDPILDQAVSAGVLMNRVSDL